MISERVVIGSARWADAYGYSLELMVGAYETIIVGRVAEVLLPYDPRPGYLGVPPDTLHTPEPPPPGHPKASVPTPSLEELSRPPGRLFTVYSVEVMQVIASPDRLLAGDAISLGQHGGVFEGVAYEMANDPVLQVGTTYLFFLHKKPTDAANGIFAGDFEGAPFGRFTVDAQGQLGPADEAWANLPAAKALTGATMDQAAAMIEAAIAGEPIPTPVPPSPSPIDSKRQAIDTLAIDTDADNTATSLGTVKTCNTLTTGGRLTIDIAVDAVPVIEETGDGMAAFQFVLHYDPSVLKVTAADASMLLAANSGSSLVHLGDATPDADGSFVVVVGDLSGSTTAESGSGVLDRITLEGVGRGVGELTLTDVLVVDSSGNPYTINNLLAAEVAVDVPCPP